jgi:superfamily I DNA/RNA helicase
VKEIIEGLNSEQTEAVKEIEKPLLIIAGAGSTTLTAGTAGFFA